MGKLRIKWLLTHDIPRNGTITVTLHHEFPHWTNTESYGYSYKNHHAMAQLQKHNSINTGCLQKNGADSKVNKKLISHLTRAQRTPSAAATVQVSHVLPAVRFSRLMRGHGTSFQDGVAAGKGFLCAPF